MLGGWHGLFTVPFQTGGCNEPIAVDRGNCRGLHAGFRDRRRSGDTFDSDPTPVNFSAPARLARAGLLLRLGALERVSERCRVLGFGERNAQYDNLFIFLARRFKHSTSGFVNPFANQIEQARE
jgi:hypothetical protein